MKWNQRCQAEVDLSALRRNYRRLRGLLAPEQKYLAVVKADAYGHGAIEAARIRRPCLLCKNEKEVTSLEFLQTIT